MAYRKKSTDTRHLVRKTPGGKLILPDMSQIGPCMRALNYKQQKFVRQYLVHHNATRAFIEAGYAPESANNNASHHLHLEHIQAAIQEEARKLFVSSGPKSHAVMAEVMDNPMLAAKDRLRAAELIANRAGLHAMSEHKVTVAHTMDHAALIQKLKALGEELGMDVSKPLAEFGDPLALEAPEAQEAEFVEVEDLEDLLK